MWRRQRSRRSLHPPRQQRPLPEAHALAGCCHGAIDRLAGAGVTGYMNATENRFVEDYRFAASVGACRVYLANDIQTHAERASALTYVEQFKAECAQYPRFTSAGTLCFLVRRLFAATGQ